MIIAVLPGRSAEAAVRTAAALPGMAGFAVGADLLAGPGPAIVAAFEGDVLALAGLHGAPERAASAGRRLAGYGATWVTVQATDGPILIGAVASTGVGVVATTLRHGQDDAEAAKVGGRSRGKAVSRLSEIAAEAGAIGVLCDLPDIGVVAQVAGDLARFVVVDTPSEAAEAMARGGSYAVIEAAMAADARDAVAAGG